MKPFSPRGFRLLPHTADILLEVRGKDLPELYETCVEALFSQIVDRRRVRVAGERVCAVSGRDPEERLFLILKEALLLFSLDLYLVRTARVTIKGNSAELKAAGETLVPLRHFAGREIKAVTAHGMTVEKVPGGYVARFVVDV